MHDLSNAKVDVLTAAATSWEQIATKLRAMDGEWNSVVVAKVNGSGWTGKSSELAKPALQRGNDQLGAAATEAAAIASVLGEAARDIQAAKDKAAAVVAEVTAAGYTVSPDGGTVNWPAPDKATVHDPEASRTYQDKCRAKAEGFQRRIGNVLREATEADQRACFALRADATTDKDGSFNAQAVGGGPEADAKRAAQLAAKGKKLTDPDLLELNSLLAAHGGDPVFTTRFYETVGPKGLLVFWDNMVGADSGVGGVSDARLQQYQDLQKNLGTTLATATRTSNQPHLSDQWAADLRKAGAELLSEEPPVGMGTRPYIPRGYQVLAGILRTGNYDPHFLNPIAEHVLQLDAKDTNRTRPFWPDFGGDKRGIFNIVGQDGAAGYQPLTGILEALGHIVDSTHKDTLAVAQDVAGQQWDSGRSASGNSAAQAVRDAAVGSGLSGKDINDLAANAGHSAVQGGAAGAVANRTAGGKGWRGTAVRGGVARRRTGGRVHGDRGRRLSGLAGARTGRGPEQGHVLVQTAHGARHTARSAAAHGSAGRPGAGSRFGR
ncbi:hypothetical protein ACIRYZ_28620 [Kitasatospora sp. NPDC101155]|uniref:hypothetical protein n=1 Tax=Kitasatospora sp. NPDC101155 TaxID=3364097 RepID=UPI00380B4489